MSILRLILSILLLCQFCLPAQADDRWHFSAPASSSQATTPTDYWLETSFALAGSAVGNGAALLTFFLMDILPSALHSEAPETDWISAGGAIWSLLLLIPMITTPLTLHFFYPLPEDIQADPWQTALGSFITVSLHALLMIPLFLLVQQPNLSQSVYLVAPLAFFSAVLIEGMGTAWFYNQSRHFILKTADNGLGLVYQLSF